MRGRSTPRSPAASTWIPTHFEAEAGRPIAIANHVHLFSDHVRAACREGWSLADLDERVVDEAWARRQPGYRKHLDRPVSFLLAWRRPGRLPVR
jgi:hypothetical protein